MVYSTRYLYLPQYKLASQNQHGSRFKLGGEKRLTVLLMTTTFDNAEDLASLIYISSKLHIPVQWDATSDPQTAFIEIVSTSEIKKQ